MSAVHVAFQNLSLVLHYALLVLQMGRPIFVLEI